MDHETFHPEQNPEEINEEMDVLESVLEDPELPDVPVGEPAAEAPMTEAEEAAFLESVLEETELPDAPVGEQVTEAPMTAEEETAFLEAVLENPELPELGPHEALDHPAFTNPEDAELEKILQEMQEEADLEGILAEPILTPEEALNAFLQEPEETEIPQEFPPDTAYPPQSVIPQSRDTMLFTPQDPQPAEVTPEPQEEQKPPKGRPKFKKGYGFFGIPHLVVTAVWLLIIVMIGVTLGRTLWVCCADLMAFGKPDREITVTITDEEVGDIDAIARKLHELGAIDQPAVFKFFAEITGKDQDIAAGTYVINSALDYNAMIKHMMPQSPTREIVDDLLIPEGYNCAQIFQLLEDNGVCTVAELEEYAANGELDDYWFLEGVERGTPYCLEGYLFPDTYDFYTNDDPERVLEKMLDDFDYRFTERMREDFAVMQGRYAQMLASNGYDQAYIDEHPLTLHQVVTMASIVQKETANNSESYTIASVFYNRITNLREHPFMGSDATVYYAIGDYFGEKEELTQEDIAFDSPYNTRSSIGLPPGPICNPGIYSIYAALDPDDTDYYYFIYSPQDACHLFSETLREHEALAEKLGY